MARTCRRRVPLPLPTRGEHPDLDGDREDHSRPVDAALIVGQRARGILPPHGWLPRAQRVVVSGRGRVVVTVIVELGRGASTRTVRRVHHVRVYS